MKLSYRPEIDGLRAIAIVLVFFYHADILLFDKKSFPFFKGGFIGVDIFFVISGYLISSIILKELKIDNKFNLLNFYERRARRILPALFLIMTFSLLLGYLFLSPNKFVELSKSIIFSEFFVSNYFFWKDGLIYGSEDSFIKPFLHSWSLSVEEQFYLFFPLAMLIIFKIKKNLILHLIVYLIVISFFTTNLTVLNFPSLSFYSIHARIWELACGSLVAFLEVHKSFKISKFKLVIRLSFQFIALFLLFFAIFKFNQNTLHPSFNTLVPVLSIMLLISSLNENDFITKILSNKILVGTGLISYSLYLIHFPILSIANNLNFENLNYSLRFAVLLSIILLSIISFYFVERPFRNKNLVSRKKFSILIFLSFILLLVINLIVIKKNGFIERLPYILQKSLTEKRPWTLLKSNDEIECYSRKGQPCTFGREHKKEFYLLGDSHLAAMSSEIKKIALKNNFKYVDLTMPRCLYLPNFVRVNKNNGKVSNFCNEEYQKKVEMIIEQSSKESAFVIGGRLPMYISGKKFDNKEGGVEPGKVWLEEFKPTKYDITFQIQFKDTLEKIALSGRKIILIYPIPEVGFDVKDELYKRIPKNIINLDKNKFQKSLKDNPVTTSYKIYKERTKKTFELLDSIKGKNIFRVYPHKVFCKNKASGRCNTHDDKNIYYFDNNHLSLSGTKMILSSIFKFNR
jgi:peptidoglycan/LPS O-acetylase OafA/YrhL